MEGEGGAQDSFGEGSRPTPPGPFDGRTENRTRIPRNSCPVDAVSIEWKGKEALRILLAKVLDRRLQVHSMVAPKTGHEFHGIPARLTPYQSNGRGRRRSGFFWRRFSTDASRSIRWSHRKPDTNSTEFLPG